MKVMIIAVIMSVMASQAFAQQSVKLNDPVVSVEFSSYWLSQYVSPFDMLVSKNAVVQSEARIWIEPGGDFGRFYADIWHSIDDRGSANSNTGDEIDYTLGWKGNLYRGISLNLWATYFDFVPMGKELGGDQIRFNAELERKLKFGETVSVSPSIRFEVPWGLKGYQDPSGLRVYPGVKGSWEFISGCSINQRIGLCLDDGACGLQPGTFIDYKVGFSWQIEKWLMVEPFSFRIIGPLATMSDGRKTEMIFGSGLTVKF